MIIKIQSNTHPLIYLIHFIIEIYINIPDYRDICTEGVLIMTTHYAMPTL